MIEFVAIQSSSDLDFKAFLHYMSVADTVRDVRMISSDNTEEWYFYREEYSTTRFLITQIHPTHYILSMDRLASVEDYRFFPYLVDSLAKFLNGKIENIPVNKNIYQFYNDDWMEETIADEIARLKGSLTVAHKYYLSQPIEYASYVSKRVLAQYGVTLTSATPRIYGYIQYMLTHDLLPASSPDELEDEIYYSPTSQNEEVVVDVPQHISIGKVKSWQLNGEETYESYSREDVNMLVILGHKYLDGTHVEGVVLNDIGTLYQEGIGVSQNASEAAEWFKRALKEGDSLYAPTNLGDLYRKGAPELPSSLSKALYYYMKSTDPYSFYRIGQSYEEGWTVPVDMDKAMIWYKKAADAGHHLAIKRLSQIQ